MEHENIASLLELATRLIYKNPFGSITVYRSVLHFLPNDKRALAGIAQATAIIEQKPVSLHSKRIASDVINKIFRYRHSDENLAGIMDLAKSQEHNHPFDAYLLYRTIQKIEPNISLVDAKVAKYEKIYRQNMVLAFREDGLCQRVIAILLGYFSSKHMGFEFRFMWPHTAMLNNTFDLKFGAGHSVRTDVFQVLSAEFIERHLLSAKNTKMIWNAIPTGTPRHFRVTFRSLAQIRPERDIIRPCWRAANQIMPDLNEFYSPENYRDFIENELFTPEIEDKLKEIRDLELPEKRIAIHLRGGDVVYGNARKRFSAARELTLSLAVAEEICRKHLNQGYTVFVFGASKNDIEYLTLKYTNVLSVSDIKLSPADDPESVLREVALMADCEKLFAAENSAVSDLASLLGRAEFITGADILPPEEEYRVLCACIASGTARVFHRLQRAYLNFSAFLTAPETTPFEQLKLHILAALDDDDDRAQYWFLLYLTALATGDQSLVSNSRHKLNGILETEIEVFFDTQHRINKFIRLQEPVVRRLLHAAIQSQLLLSEQKSFLITLRDQTK
jgi:hypothetical protein